MTDSTEARLGAWLSERIANGGEVEVTDWSAPDATGYSAETTMFSASYDGRDGTTVERKLVLRSEYTGPQLYPDQAEPFEIGIELQRRVMEAVAAHSSVPLADVIGHESDPSVIGSPFFVMDFIGGDVPDVFPPYTTDGFFVEATPEQRETLVLEGVRAVAQIHAIDWRGAGLDWLVPDGADTGSARQVGLWEQAAHDALDGRDFPVLWAAFDKLRATDPDESEAVLCWGDARPGNIIFDDFRPACITDWEAAAIAPPEMDLGWWLMFDRTVHEGFGGVGRVEGEPTRDEQRAAYEKAAGRTLGDMGYHELFGAVRYAVVLVHAMDGMASAGKLPADQTFWRENPAVEAIQDLLDA